MNKDILEFDGIRYELKSASRYVINIKPLRYGEQRSTHNGDVFTDLNFSVDAELLPRSQLTLFRFTDFKQGNTYEFHGFLMSQGKIRVQSAIKKLMAAKV